MCSLYTGFMAVWHSEHGAISRQQIAGIRVDDYGNKVDVN